MSNSQEFTYSPSGKSNDPPCLSYIKDLFINKTISESSKQLYMNNLNKLNLNKPIEDLDF